MSSNLRKAVIKMYQLKSKFYKVNTPENIEFCQKKKLMRTTRKKKYALLTLNKVINQKQDFLENHKALLARQRNKHIENLICKQ